MNSVLLYSFVLFFFAEVGGTGDRMQGLALARQAFYRMS